MDLTLILCLAGLLTGTLSVGSVWVLRRRLTRATAQVSLARELLHRHRATPLAVPSTEAELKDLRTDVRALEEVVNAISAEITHLKANGSVEEHVPLERQTTVLRFRLAVLEGQLARLHLSPEHRPSAVASESAKAA